jgi:hypothetical protein
MVDLIEFINDNKELIVKELYNWSETFNCELDEDGEKTDVPYETVYSLAERLENGVCTNEDYINIEFHIFQMNYDEIIIDLGFPSGCLPDYGN